LGLPVRYDGARKAFPSLVSRLQRHADLIPVCPEVAIGLGVPRDPIQLMGDPKSPWLVGVEDVSHDLTRQMQGFSQDEALRLRYINPGFALRAWIYRLPMDGRVDFNNREQVLDDFRTFLREFIDNTQEPIKLFINNQWVNTETPDERGISLREKIKDTVENKDLSKRRLLYRLPNAYPEINEILLAFYAGLAWQMYDTDQYNGLALIRTYALSVKEAWELEGRGIKVIQTYFDVSVKEQAKRARKAEEDYEALDELSEWVELKLSEDAFRLNTDNLSPREEAEAAAGFIQKKLGNAVTTHAPRNNHFFEFHRKKSGRIVKIKRRLSETQLGPFFRARKNQIFNFSSPKIFGVTLA